MMPLRPTVLQTVVGILTEEAAINSFRVTAVPFGIPDYLPIGFFGAVLGVDRLKKWKNKKKESAKNNCNECAAVPTRVRIKYPGWLGFIKRAGDPTRRMR